MEATSGSHYPTLESVNVTLHNTDLWKSFHRNGTEMIITRTGRRMFPYMRLEVSGLDPSARYYLMLEMCLSSDSRFKFSGSDWVPVGNAEPHHLLPRTRLYYHPDSPATGAHWTGQHVLFNKVKLSNNSKLDSSAFIVLNSMHKYQPKVHVVLVSDTLALNWSPRATFTFPETEFIAVTAYQNDKVTKLKIDNNPFAKGFRESGGSRPKRKRSEETKQPEKLKKVTPDVRPSSVPDDSGFSSLGSPTPPVTTSPAILYPDPYPPPPLYPSYAWPDVLPYFHHSFWPYPYLLSPSTPPVYPAPYFPYMIPSYQPTNEPFLMDLSLRKSPLPITEH